MARNGIPIAEFSERIGENGAIIRKWPFTDLIPSAQSALIETDLGYGHNTTDGIAVGQVLSVNEDAATLRVEETDYRMGGSDIRLQLDNAEIAKAWQQLVGVALAAEVTVIHGDADTSITFHPTSILAVEPPMTHPEFNDGARLTHRTGYVQGLVTDRKMVRFTHVVGLATSDTDDPVTLNCMLPPYIRMPNNFATYTIRPGDFVRAEIDHQSDVRKHLYVAKGPMNLIGRLWV